MSMSNSNTGLPLPVLYRTALELGSKAYSLPTIQDETQSLIKQSQAYLLRVINAIDSLALFSTNETADDLATGDLVYLLAPYVLTEIISRLRIEDPEERKTQIVQCQRLLKQFTERLEEYSIVSDLDVSLTKAGNTASGADFSSRREMKIKQFKREKELRSKISELRRRWNGEVDDDADDFSQIATFLIARKNDDDSDNDHEADVRQTMLHMLRFYYARACTQQQSLTEEFELLRQIESFSDPTMQRNPEDLGDDTWRLDFVTPRGGSSNGPLLDSTGKPLRPFTILPSTNASERSRLRAEVFRPDHRLPTMTIDEYLEEEARRGNILSGGGPRSQDQPTSSEQLQLDSEMDGTLEGERKNEEKRLKDENWAAWTDDHPKGAGNRMNKG